MEKFVKYLSLLLVIIAYIFGNRERGKTKRIFNLPKIGIYAMLAALFIGVSFIVAPEYMLLPFTIPFTDYMIPIWCAALAVELLGNWICFAFGWGKIFPHGENELNGSKIYLEREFWPAEKIADLVVGKWDKPMPRDFVRKWQTVAMCARFFLTFGAFKYPLFALIYNQWLLIIIGIVFSVLAGIGYNIAFKKHTEESAIKAEYYAGLALGLANAAGLWLIM